MEAEGNVAPRKGLSVKPCRIRVDGAFANVSSVWVNILYFIRVGVALYVFGGFNNNDEVSTDGPPGLGLELFAVTISVAAYAYDGGQAFFQRFG